MSFYSATAAEPTRFAPGLVTTGLDDAHVSFSPDGKELYFLRSSPDFAHWTILVSRLESGRWSKPEVAPFSGRWNDGDVTITHDGRRLFFISNRPVGDGPARPDTELWVLERASTATGWGPPRHLDELSSPGDEWYPTLTDDGTLYFGSERAGGKGKCDLWRSKWLGDRFGPPENLGDIVNTADQEIEPLISGDGTRLVFAAKRPEGKGSYDLYVSFWCTNRWTAPRPLGSGVNTAGWEFGPRFSPDGGQFFFTSSRSDLDVAPAAPRSFDQWMSALSAPGNGLRDVYQLDAKALDLASPCRDDKTLNK